MSTKLTKDLTRIYELGDINEYPVLAGEVIYQGAAIGLDTIEGYARSLKSNDIFLGFAEDHIDNSNGSDGAKNIRVRKNGAIILDIAGIGNVDIGKAIFATNDNKFSVIAESGSVYIGQLSRIEAYDQGLVEFSAGKLSPNLILKLLPKNNTVLKTDSISRTFNPSWAVGASWENDNYKANTKLLIYMHIPMRSDSENWGGGYSMVEYSINDDDWQNLGHSGYDGVMNYGAKSIGYYSNNIVLDPNMGEDYQVKFRLKHRSYNDSIAINSGHGISGNQYFTHLIIKEI